MIIRAGLCLSLMAISLSARAQSVSGSPAVHGQETQAPVTPASGPPAGTEKIDPTKEADIRRLLELTKASALVTQILAAMEHNIKPLMIRSLPAGEYRERLVDLFFVKFRSKTQSSDLLDLIVPLYDKYYSRDEIRGLIQFYETPLGQKLVAVMPELSQESQAAGQKWGQQVGSDSMAEVLQEHPDLEKALEDAKNPFSLPK